MNNEKKQKIRLGIFVVVGTVLFVMSMYFIGSQKNIFSNTFTISAIFNNVNGLQKGNNVRLSGIDVGTVQSIEILSNNSIRVDMIIKESVRKFIKKDAIASIGTDGLMGNKLINISPVSMEALQVQDNDILQVLNSMDTDDMMSRLKNTNTYVEVIAANLVNIIENVNSGKGVLGKLIMDSTLLNDLEQTLHNVKILSQKTAAVSKELEYNFSKIDFKKNSVGVLLTDTLIARNLQQTVFDLLHTSELLEQAMLDINTIINKVDSGNGLANSLLNDSTMSNNLFKSIENIENGTDAFNENMEALKHNILFRSYFRKIEKKKKK